MQDILDVYKRQLFGYNNPYVIAAFGAHADNRTIDSCIRDVAVAILNNDVSKMCIRDRRSSLYNELLDAQAEKLGRTIRYSYDFCKNANGKRDFKE